MIWLDPSEHSEQEYIELRLYAPYYEKIVLDFNPLKMSYEPDWDPAGDDWHCYASPLRIYQQDYELLLDYFNNIFPTKDALDGTIEPVFDVCSIYWIGKEDWLKMISEIEQDMESFPCDKKSFFTGFIEWLEEALSHTSIIVVEGNL